MHHVFGYGFIPSSDVFDTTSVSHCNFMTDRGYHIWGSLDDVNCEFYRLSEDSSHRLRTLQRIADEIHEESDNDQRQHGLSYLHTVAFPMDDLEGDSPENLMQRFLRILDETGGNSADVATYIRSLELSMATPGEQEAALEETAPQPQSATKTSDEPVFNDKYQPRYIGELRDVDLIRRAHVNNMTVLLQGPPGTGKTTLCNAALHEPITVNCHDGMTISDLVGQWKPVPGSPGDFQWHDGPLVTAMETGTALILDDFPWASNTVQSALLPVLDYRREITVVDRPENQTIKAAQGFSVIITANPNTGIGIIEPIADRIDLTLDVPTDLATASALGAHPDFLAVAYRLEYDMEQRRLDGGIGWTPSIRSLLSATKKAKVFGLPIAAAAFLAECPIADVDYRTFVRDLLEAQTRLEIADGLVSQARD